MRHPIKHRAGIAGLTICALVLTPALASGQNAFRVSGVEFDWSTYRKLAPGSETWPLTWCEDDHQYSSWGNGAGFGGTAQDSAVSLGFARIEGPYSSFTGHNVWGGINPENPATFTGKSTSMLCLNGFLYAWHSDGSRESAFQWKQIIRSTDKAATWEENVFPQSRLTGCAGCPGLPYFINYGRNYTANTDGFVYVFTIRIADMNIWEVQKPGVVWLARAPAAGEAFVNTANWEWFTGLDGTGNPLWGLEAARAPVLQDPDGVMRNSALYLPGFDRYVMVTNHTARAGGNVAMWEAPKPWGPWTEILRESGWPASDPNAPDTIPGSFSYGNFSPKWLSADSRDCVFVGFGPNSWDSVECTFLDLDLTPPATPTGLAGSAASAFSVNLTWSASSDPESGIGRYRVYRDGNFVGTSILTSFTDLGLVGNTTYGYRVSAVNGDQLESPQSDAVSVTTLRDTSDSLVSNIIVITNKQYRIRFDALAVGELQYIDRDIVFQQLPSELEQLTYIQTADDDRNANPGVTEFLSFDLNQDAVVYVAHDDRGARPGWLAASGFIDTLANLRTSSGATFSLFMKPFPMGKVTLGSNSVDTSGLGSMYTVIVHAASADVDIVPPSAPSNLRIISRQ